MTQPRSLLSAVCAAVVLFAGSASAAGVNLRWNACAGDGGVSNRTSACSTTLGSQVLVASFVSPIPVPDLTAVETHFNFVVAGSGLPPWFQFNPAGSCRFGALGAAATIPSLAVNCIDPFGGGAASGIGSYTVGGSGPNTAQFFAPAVVPATSAASIVVGPEYFACQLVILNVKTTGAGACTGCSTPACIAISFMNLYTPASTAATPVAVLNAPANGVDSGYVTWQGGVGAGPLPGGACPAATPTRNSTWGAVKSLYR